LVLVYTTCVKTVYMY